MKYLVLCSAFYFLFHVDSSVATNPGKIEIEYKKSFSISCNVSANDPKDVQVTWLKEDKKISEYTSLNSRATMESPSSSNGNFVLKINNAEESDVGNYTCEALVDGKTMKSHYKVASKVYVRVPQNINVVEGEKLRIRCEVAGKPHPSLKWYFLGENDPETNKTEIPDDERTEIGKEEDGNIENAILTISNITLKDRGYYICVGTSNIGEIVESKCMVRIKDKYAALWPFLGIVAEVVILCAIIFIYEKKHNKSELDESDTDQSPDQLCK
ncbi:basigin isoform X2 [Aethina tumida]|uniref:basigin isoform X2 n=1 Tax=Aethina tumida TaxID=116153 RepID=UPI002148970D|nr:basigin isoform X2 [Aethina tumida]